MLFRLFVILALLSAPLLVRAESQPATMSATGLWKRLNFDDSTAVPWAAAIARLTQAGGVCETGKIYDYEGGYGEARYFGAYGGKLVGQSDGSDSEPLVGVGNTVIMGCILIRGNGSWAGGASPPGTTLQKTAGWQCPSTGGWHLEGQTCTRPDCPAGKKMQPDGTCKSQCEPSDGILQDGYIAKPLSQTYCNGQCEYYFQVVMESGAKGDDSHYDFTAGGVAWTYGTYRKKYPGVECKDVRAPGEPPGGPKPPVPRKKPPCEDGEGVLTTSAGHVGCVPEGVPDARKPVVNKEKKEEVYPDGSKKETESVSTKDPKTGATDVSQTAVTTAGPGGGTQAGQPGTSTSSGSSSGTGGDGKGGDGCDPTLNFCGGPDVEALYTKKEKTFQSSMETFKATVSGSPVGQASTQFFQVTAPGGGCPGWVVHVPFINVTLNGADFFCNSSILAALDGAGAVMLALATYIAFTWAFL